MDLAGEFSGRLAQHAIYILITDFEVSYHDLFAYYERIGEGLAWEDAFRESFGVSLEDFYDHFENL